MNILFCGQELYLQPSGAVFWPQENLLIVADLHLEKGSSFARRGFFLPPYDSRATLNTLKNACVQTRCKRLLLLGDSFHDAGSYGRLSPEDRSALASLSELDPIWISGNHDSGFAPPGFIPMEEYAARGLTFRHIAVPGATNEISGHYHPKLVLKKPRLSSPCFMEDGNRLILPAFGAYTGGLSVSDPVIQALFQPSVRLYVLGAQAVFAVNPPVGND